MWNIFIAQNNASNLGNQIMAIQLEIFDTDVDLCHKEYKLVFERVENVRKGIFKRHNELSKSYLELKQENQQLYCEIANLRKDIEMIKKHLGLHNPLPAIKDFFCLDIIPMDKSNNKNSFGPGI